MVTVAEIDRFTQGWNQGLLAAIQLLRCGILAKDVTPSEIANELQLMVIDMGDDAPTEVSQP